MAHLIPIGNSLGVRIPKALITQLGLNEQTPLVFKISEEGLLIQPVKQAREGWKEAFKANQVNPLLMGEEVVNQFDREEWEW